MDVMRLKEVVVWRFSKVCEILRKLCNTLFYLFSNKRNVLIVNAPLFQFLGGIRHFNLGDDLNFYLLQILSGKRVIAYNSFYHLGRPVANVMAIGSVIDWLGNSDSTVWGSGILLPSSDKLQNKALLLKKVVAVRGQKSHELLIKSGISCPAVYGDPALLLPLVYNPKVEKVKGRIGFIPHYVDVENEHIVRLMNECGENAFLIRVQKYKSWQECVRQILSCEFIVSTSLHGLILSDAYGIPNQWVVLPKALPGGNFKFEDYYSAVGKSPEAFKINEFTQIKELIDIKKSYEAITYDPKPLLKVCPFDIVCKSVLEVI